MTLPREPTPMPSDPPAPPAAPAYPYAAPAWSPPPAAPSGWPQPQPTAGQGSAGALSKARTALGWAIGAAIAAFLTLGLGVVALALAGAAMNDASQAKAAASDASDIAAESAVVYGPLRGVVWGLTDGAPLAGGDLEQPLTDLLLENGPDVQGLTCPDTSSVTISTAVVCTGTAEDSVWTGIVFFEDTEGSFVVIEP